MEDESLFGLLVLSFGNAALAGLGLVPEAGSERTKPDLEIAKQNIDLLCMLEEKTKGNLTGEERKLLTEVLYDLRVKYLEMRQQRSC